MCKVKTPKAAPVSPTEYLRNPFAGGVRSALGIAAAGRSGLSMLTRSRNALPSPAGPVMGPVAGANLTAPSIDGHKATLVMRENGPPGSGTFATYRRPDGSTYTVRE